MKIVIKILVIIAAFPMLALGQTSSQDSLILQRRLIREVVKQAKKQDKIQPFDDFYTQNSSTLLSEATQDFFIKKAAFVYEKNKKLLKDLPMEQKILHPTTKEILGYYRQAQKAGCECYYSIMIERLEFLKNTGIPKTYYENNLLELKQNGYKASRQGVGIGAQIYQGKNTWIGAEIALSTTLQPRYKMKKRDEETKAHSSSSFSGSFGVFGYAYDMKTKSSDYTFSLVQTTAPILLKPLQFGFNDKLLEGRGSFFYRPEIGFGFGPFSLSAGRTIHFTKEAREKGEKVIIAARFLYPINKK